MSLLARITKPESTSRQELSLHSGPAQAIELCREVVQTLGWSATEGTPPDHWMTVREDIAHLCCGDSPIRIDIEMRAGPDGGSVASVEGIVPGVGGLASKHLNDCMRAFVLMLGRRDRALVQG